MHASRVEQRRVRAARAGRRRRGRAPRSRRRGAPARHRRGACDRRERARASERRRTSCSAGRRRDRSRVDGRAARARHDASRSARPMLAAPRMIRSTPTSASATSSAIAGAVGSGRPARGAIEPLEHRAARPSRLASSGAPSVESCLVSRRPAAQRRRGSPPLSERGPPGAQVDDMDDFRKV